LRPRLGCRMVFATMRYPRVRTLRRMVRHVHFPLVATLGSPVDERFCYRTYRSADWRLPISA
jgi:hypothetical protein